MSQFKIGWIGVGTMGTPMCRNLLRANYPVFACDIDAARLTAIVNDGAVALAHPSEIARRSDIVISMVPNDKALLSVVEGPAGLAASMTPGKIFVDMSTVSPAASARVAGALEATGCLYLRAPVSGSTALAEKGALSMYCSGPREAFERCEPIVAKLSTRQTYVGGSEEARVLKLLINIIVLITPVALGEALAFGQKGGLHQAQIIGAIGQSVAASPLMAYKTEMLKARDWSPMASIDLVSKDLDLAIECGKLNNVPMPLTSLIRQYYAAFQASGDGQLDFFSLVTWPERMIAKTEYQNAMDTMTVENEIRTLEDRRYKAMLGADVATLSDILSDDLIYSHSRGDRDNKTDYIRKVKDGVFRYIEITHLIDRIAIFGDSALLWERMIASVAVGGEIKELNNACLSVWVKQSGRWQFVAYQPTPLPT